MDVVRRPVLLMVCLGPGPAPRVIDQDIRLMLSRTPGKIRKLLRNVIGKGVSYGLGLPVPRQGGQTVVVCWPAWME